MLVAMRDSYMEFVVFAGVNENYPRWFEKLLEECIYTDESRFTFYVDPLERRPDYYEKQLVEDYSVIIRRPADGDIHVMDYEVFAELYTTFRFNQFSNSGVAAFDSDCIEYVECKGGELPKGYPAWFYEYFTEAINFPPDDETIFFYDKDNTLTASREGIQVGVGGDVSVTKHCVFLKNKLGEVRGMSYEEFLKFYDPSPDLGMGG